MDSKKKKMDDGPGPSKDGQPKRKGGEGEVARLILSRPEIEESLDASLANLLK